MIRYALGAVWLIVAVVAGVASVSGGDASIVGWWFSLIWTIPFGVIWWFCLFDLAQRFMPTDVAANVGVGAVIVVTFIWWFIVWPRIGAMARRRQRTRPDP